MLEVDIRLTQGDFRLEVQAAIGPTTAVLGPSGSGKSSLLKAIAGLRRASGRVTVGDVVLQDTERGIFLAPDERRLGYVPQSGALFPHLSVLRNLLFGVRRERRQEVTADGGPLDELAEALDLGNLLDRHPRYLSGGEQRRVALARALLSRPRFLLLDEPTAGLDPVRARRALAQIRRLQRSRDVPLLVVTHREEEAHALAREVLLLEGGRCSFAGPLRGGGDLVHAGHPGKENSNVLEGRVELHSADGGITSVRMEDGALIRIPVQTELALGSTVLLSVKAEEVMISTREPVALSARNIFPATTDEVIEIEGSCFVRAGAWLAHLTAATVRELDLRVGQEIWLVVKTHSWRVLAG